MQSARTFRPLGILLVAAALALHVVSAANAKLWPSFSVSIRAPKTHEPVAAVLRSHVDPGRDCHMKLLAVAPGADRFRALDAFLIGRVGVWGPTGYFVRKVTPTPRMGFLTPLKRVGRRAWRTTIRFPRPGAWRLIVPNECADGYRYPPPVEHVVTVR